MSVRLLAASPVCSSVIYIYIYIYMYVCKMYNIVCVCVCVKCLFFLYIRPVPDDGLMKKSKHVARFEQQKILSARARAHTHTHTHI